MPDDGALTMPDPRNNDPILEEVRRNREELLRAAGGSIDALYASLKESEQSEQRPVVKLPPRRLPDSDSDAA